MLMSKEEKQKCIEIGATRAQEFRQAWKLPDAPIKDINSLVETKEFLLLRFPNDYGISGIYLKKKDGDRYVNCIYINNGDPIGRQNFTIAHELYHAFYEPSTVGICMQTNKNEDPIEMRADSFASHLLIPRDKLALILSKLFNGKTKAYRILSFDTIIRIQTVFQVSFQAIIYAIDDLKNYPELAHVLPNNSNAFRKYYLPKYWDELIDKSERINCFLNTPNPKYEFPDRFKDNLIKNYKKGIIQEEDLLDIFDFFDTVPDESLGV